jgi:hypothetical protein
VPFITHADGSASYLVKGGYAPVLAQSPCDQGLRYAMAPHPLWPLIISAGINLADQRVALPVGIDESDRKIVCGSADDPPGDVTDIL